MSGLDRRTLLKQIVGGAAALGFGPSAWPSTAHAAPAAVLDELLESFGGLAAVRPLGAAYVAAFPERDLAALLEALGLHLGGARSAAQWLGELRCLQRDDFARGRTCRLRGWIVSETEAGLCAAFVLRHAARDAA